MVRSGNPAAIRLPSGLNRTDGTSLLPLLRGEAGGDRDLVFECGTHVGINFACGIQSWTRGGGHFLYTYNACSGHDELHDLTQPDAANLAASPAHAATRKEMIGRMGGVLAGDPRWVSYWSSFRLDRYFDLPKSTSGDMQLRAR